jgi:hypothetical protein
LFSLELDTIAVELNTKTNSEKENEDEDRYTNDDPLPVLTDPTEALRVVCSRRQRAVNERIRSCRA